MWVLIVLYTIKARDCELYDVTSKSVTTWKKEFIENRVTVFSKNKDTKTDKNELSEKDDYIDKLHGTVGELL